MNQHMETGRRRDDLAELPLSAGISCTNYTVGYANIIGAKYQMDQDHF